MKRRSKSPVVHLPELDGVLPRYTREESQLIPLLQEIQDTLGYISPEAMQVTARHLNVPESSVYGVVTFYSQFYLTRQGRHKVKVCQGTACHVRGAVEIIRAVSARLGIKPGETTEDFEFSVERVACFGSCALAPVVVIDEKVYGNVTPEMAVRMLDELV
ncbi:MAG: NADH-quinone oxidoreductase subunit NuoE [Kiritimatiellia bacterium]|jgi:NADH-quinone oxidoreductase subunit E|nr:NADH-quinone oxidoreductase subunit NuoE [Kiritimatiellia bacterium]MDP6630379.1 NADH-quinone oxidoreductase subunit NuoE [Kiritimatiellia bacterium]MDP6809836.1 NADH-quinone oxidoreductase subunit NuoE [Kiritimatiellia bacterium]MDP7024228.1 NADH-quinone oxidoreductase subunit NuoE [Kiritimatiellia bacterium]